MRHTELKTAHAPFIAKMTAGTPTLSAEFFPPKNPAGWSMLYSTMGEIAQLKPDFVSVTYGAGGSTREKTVELVRRIEKELGIEAVAHLTCVGHSAAELTRILATLKSNGIHSIMALRGDAPKGENGFQPHPDGFAHGCDLIALADSDPELCIGCAFYPEKHLEAESLEQDIKYLKYKQDCGADFAVSQIFFDNESFYRYRDLAAAAGVTLPLVAGILPFSSQSQVNRIAAMCGTKIPEPLRAILDTAGDESLIEQGVEYAIAQCRDLLDHGIGGIHLYTFNQHNSSVRIINSLRSDGYIPL